MTGPEDYALSKDLDVALCMDFRALHRKPALVDVIDFVIVNSCLHDKLTCSRGSTILQFPSHGIESMRTHFLLHANCCRGLKYARTPDHYHD